MKVLVIGNFHHKNVEGLKKILDFLKYEYYFTRSYTIRNIIEKYDIIISPCHPIDTNLYPNKKFIFGPHFSVFPTNQLLKINNINKNSIYIQPSKWAMQTWKMFNIRHIIPLKIQFFPVDTKKFIPIDNIKKDKVFIYFKRRKKEELFFLETFLKNKKIEYKIFDYVKKYKEEDYLNFLQHSLYGIVLDAHESQGFAIQEALSCNVPLLVWNVTSMAQEEGARYKAIPATSIPYWDNNCGVYFYNKNEFEHKYDEFINKLNTYKPREFILENLSVEKSAECFKNILNL